VSAAPVIVPGANKGRGFLAAIGRAARSVFPFSARGVALIALAAAVFAVGIIRTDLAALFWGASFLLFAAYALVAGHFLHAVLRRGARRSLQFLSVVLPSAGVSPGEQTEARMSARLPRVFPPGFSARLLLPLSWHDRRIDSVALRMAPGKNDGNLFFSAVNRGAYASTEALLETRDVIGLTRQRLRVPLREKLTVFPSLKTGEELAWFMEQADESSADARRRRRSEELLEVRKYYPGDDMRRLNWKVFAHLNELFLRVGEEVPPPESRILFVLDSTLNPLVPAAAAADYLDGLVSSCASQLITLLDRRIEVMLSLPGLRECRSYTEESRSALLAALAEAWWTDAPWAPDLPGRKSLHVAVFSSPGSPGLRPILARVHRHSWSASLFLKAFDQGPRRRAPRLRDYLFLPGDAERSPAPPPVSRRERREIQDALLRDLAAFRAPGGLVKHAAAI
jgi:uncharacterized protein (DUF58 family)